MSAGCPLPPRYIHARGADNVLNRRGQRGTLVQRGAEDCVNHGGEGVDDKVMVEGRAKGGTGKDDGNGVDVGGANE